MRILGWVQSKLNGRQGKRFELCPSSSHCNPSKQNTSREEFKDWPQTFFAIGTFGNSELREDSQMARTSSETQESSHEISDLNIEEVIEFQKEISRLVNLNLSSSDKDGAESGEMKLSLQEEDDDSSSLKVCKGSTGDSDDPEITLSKLKDPLGIRQRSLSFLLKKMFMSRSSFSSPLSLRDSISETKLEKILRKIIHKKIHPQSVSRTPTMKYLQKNNGEEKVEERSKWVKTDSEYIVLEI